MLLGAGLLEPPTLNGLLSTVQTTSQSLYPHLNNFAASLNALSAATDVTHAVIGNVSQSLNLVFDQMTDRLQTIVSATVIENDLSAVHLTMTNTLQSTQALLAATVANITTTESNVTTTTTDRFARTALDVKTLMHSLAVVHATNSTSPLYVLSISLGAVHNVSRTCAQLFGHPQQIAVAIGEAARAVEELHDSSLEGPTPTNNTADALHGIIATYSESVHAVTAQLGRLDIKGKVVQGPGPELKLRGPVYYDDL